MMTALKPLEAVLLILFLMIWLGLDSFTHF